VVWYVQSGGIQVDVLDLGTELMFYIRCIVGGEQLKTVELYQ